LETLRIDDPLDAFAVHGACGAWGVIASGLFSEPHFSKIVAGHSGGGLVYGGYDLFVANLVYVLATCVLTIVLSAILFVALSKLNLLRADHSSDRIPDAGAFTNAAGQHSFDSSKHGVPYEQPDSASNDAKHATKTHSV